MASMKRLNLPSLSKIRAYWWQEVDNGYRFETEELFSGSMHAGELAFLGHGNVAPVCFGCGMHTGHHGPTRRWLHRGHLIAESVGGTPTVDNLVPICARCNTHMPSFEDREAAIDWLAERERWPAYLAKIDAVTPPHVHRGQVVEDAANGTHWTPERFAAHYGKHHNAEPDQRPVPVMQALPAAPEVPNVDQTLTLF